MKFSIQETRARHTGEYGRVKLSGFSRVLYAGPLALACLFISPSVQSKPLQVSQLADLSFEELASIQITSVSKRNERLADAAASVFVITADDIRRSGATVLPDVLRIAPNLQVAQVSASGYAITARGFNGSNNSAPNKLLVLIDGRSVYSPLFSGVFWDVQDMMLENIERIEVISGPGGILWGTNAVNGVINVITRSASDTQGTLLTAGAGTRDAIAAFRQGGELGAGGHYRISGKYLDRRRSSLENEGRVNDSMHRAQVGFRADWDRPGNQFMITGNVYNGGEQQAEPGAISVSGTALPLGDINLSGVNLTTRWEHHLDGGGTASLQAYYDRTKRSVPPTFSETLDIFDLQFQHSLRAVGDHAVVWGANFRYSQDRVINSPYFAFLPAAVNQRWPSLFAQDEISLRDDLRLTVGARVERNDYTGAEILPSARLAWKLTPDHLLWTAASRAVRAPSRLDVDAFIPGTAPFLLNGGAPVRSELANVFEIGYRGKPAADFTYSATAFHTVYQHLRTQEIAPSRTFIVFGNEMEGSTSGVEMWGAYQVSAHWRLRAGYTALRERLRLKSTSNDLAAPAAAGNDPAHTWQVRSSWVLGSGRELDLALRHVSALSKNSVPAYTAVDARFGWTLHQGLDLSVVAQNLFRRHAEYGAVEYRSVIDPGIFAMLQWRI
ncbi:N/A [soil metagenome]